MRNEFARINLCMPAALRLVLACFAAAVAGMSGAAPPAASLCLRAPAGRSLQLRGAGDTAVSEAMRSAQHACPWDVVTGPGRFK